MFLISVSQSMSSFIPYDASRLRCHPMFVQLVDTGVHLQFELSIWSRRRLSWTCSCCPDVFETCPDFMRSYTGRCKKHSRNLQAQERRLYQGDIPIEVRSFLRAAVVHQRPDAYIIEYITMSTSCNWSAENITLFAQEMRGIPMTDLLDNRFWMQNKKQNYPILSQTHPKRRKEGTTIYYWLPDYVYWAPVIRMAKWDRTILMQLWYSQIHGRLFLPRSFWDNCTEAFTARFDWQLAVKLVLSLGRCMAAYYGVIPKPDAYDNCGWFLTILTRTTVITDEEIARNKIMRLIDFATHTSQLVD
jgi:hypothetical protein